LRSGLRVLQQTRVTWLDVDCGIDIDSLGDLLDEGGSVASLLQWDSSGHCEKGTKSNGGERLHNDEGSSSVLYLVASTFRSRISQ